MSWLQTVNDVRGAMTYQEALRALGNAYEDLTALGTPSAMAAARELNTLRNRLGSKTVRENYDLGGAAPGTVRQDEALSTKDAASMARLADELEAKALPGGGEIDPEAKLDIIDRAKPVAGAGLIALIFGLFVYLFGRR